MSRELLDAPLDIYTASREFHERGELAQLLPAELRRDFQLRQACEQAAARGREAAQEMHVKYLDGQPFGPRRRRFSYSL
jgi:hypothetical protein